MPYFASRGYPTAALSLRGTGGTYAGDGVTKVKIDEHVEDLEAFVRWCGTSEGGFGCADNYPVLVAHSFGGLAVMKYLERGGGRNSESIGGVCAMCSVPPSGNSPMTMRFLMRSLSDSWKITAGLAMKKVITDKALCRELFFGDPEATAQEGDVSDEELARYMGCFARDTVATIDLADLATKLPSKTVDEEGSAPYLKILPPALVIGAADDFIVDREGVEETARYFGLKEPTMVDSPHDVMLGGRWKNGAEALESWLEQDVC